MNIVKAYSHRGCVVTTPFGWDRGPSEADIRKMPPDQQELARKIWPRIHQGLDKSLLNRIIEQPGFKWSDYPVICPVDADMVMYDDADAQGVSNLRLIGPWWEVRMKHMPADGLTAQLREAVVAERPVAAGTVLGEPGNVGLSVGTGPSKGIHLHYSFLAWGAAAERFFDGALGPGWMSDEMGSLVKQYGAPVSLQSSRRGISWMSRSVLRKQWDPYLKMPCYEADPSALGM